VSVCVELVVVVFVGVVYLPCSCRLLVIIIMMGTSALSSLYLFSFLSLFPFLSLFSLSLFSFLYPLFSFLYSLFSFLYSHRITLTSRSHYVIHTTSRHITSRSHYVIHTTSRHITFHTHNLHPKHTTFY
jgi:hypothetical protein